MHNNVPYMKTSLCANVQLNSTNFDFNLKSSLTPFFRYNYFGDDDDDDDDDDGDDDVGDRMMKTMMRRRIFSFLAEKVNHSPKISPLPPPPRTWHSVLTGAHYWFLIISHQVSYFLLKGFFTSRADLLSAFHKLW